MIDRRSSDGLPAHSATVEAGQLRFSPGPLARPTRSTSWNPPRATPAIHRCQCRRPSSSRWMLTRKETDWREQAGIQLPRVLHGEQRFSYNRMGHAGDTMHFESRITDVYDEKNSALSFVVTETRISNQHGEHVADVRKSLVHRNS